MNLLYIGEMGDAVNSLIAFSKVVSKVIIVNTEVNRTFKDVPGMKEALGESCQVWNLYESRSVFDRRIPSRLRKFWRYLTCLLGVPILKILNRHSKKTLAVKDIIERQNIDIVFAAWGTDVIPDIIFLRTISSRIPIVHYLAAFPTSQTSWLREKIELFLFRKTIRYANGFIAASDKMKNFLMRQYDMDDNSILVCPIYYTSEHFATKRLSPLSDTDHEPHLVCTGSMNFSYPGNNVLNQIIEVAHAKVHVHCMRIKNPVVSDPYVHIFERIDTPDMVVGKLAEFMTQFDGCLILYNAPRQRMRYEFSIPQRFLFCFAVGIPIFMPKGIFRSCEEIIEKRQIGVVYNSIEELNRALRDPKAMNVLKNNAKMVSRDFAFEAESEQLLSFLSGCCSNTC
jgi:hypothetical protein